MAGRKPLKDDRRKNAVPLYLTDKELEVLDAYCKEERITSRSRLILESLFEYKDGKPAIKPNADDDTIIRVDEKICDPASCRLIRKILNDNQKFEALMTHINDSKLLSEE